MFPITDRALKARLIVDLDTYLADNVQAWELSASGEYRRLQRGADAQPVAAQVRLLAQLAETS